MEGFDFQGEICQAQARLLHYQILSCEAIIHLLPLSNRYLLVHEVSIIGTHRLTDFKRISSILYYFLSFLTVHFRTELILSLACSRIRTVSLLPIMQLMATEEKPFHFWYHVAEKWSFRH